jgi:hypothetical protein
MLPQKTWTDSIKKQLQMSKVIALYPNCEVKMATLTDTGTTFTGTTHTLALYGGLQGSLFQNVLLKCSYMY